MVVIFLRVMWIMISHELRLIARSKIFTIISILSKRSVVGMRVWINLRQHVGMNIVLLLKEAQLTLSWVGMQATTRLVNVATTDTMSLATTMREATSRVRSSRSVETRQLHRSTATRRMVTTTMIEMVRGVVMVLVAIAVVVTTMTRIVTMLKGTVVVGMTTISTMNMML